MSTMLRYAAMTLLSKTLQTFLYKYLVDVDVDGVAMPSLIDAEGNSGWGVKLSNVRLREGVELMELPGKRHVVIRKKKQRDGRDREEENVEDADDDSSAQKEKPPSMNGAASASVVDGQDDSRPQGEEENLLADTIGRRSRLNSEASVVSEFEGASSWGCFRTDAAAESGYKSDDHDSGIQTPSFASRANGLSPANSALEDSVAKKLDFHADHGDDESNATKDEEEEEAKTPATDEQEEEDDEFTFQQDMQLRLGQGGRIGTLNIRLVGKELYVLVEDAFLVVEAVPKSEENEKDTKDSATTAETKTAEDETKTAQSPEKKTPGGVKDNESRTVADRVMSSSGIARALSAIPRLLLRDCRVRFVVRGDESTPSTSETNAEIGSDDTVVEIGVELLSVTNGEDFLAHFGSEDEDPSSTAHRAGDGLATTYGLTRTSSLNNALDEFESTGKNEYLTKRIRTGKGPEGGVWVKVFPPGRTTRHDLTHMFGADKSTDDSSTAPQWALHRWYASQQMCFFRCSGLDLRARMYLGKKKDLAQAGSINSFYGDEYDEYTIDSMLFGCDYVVPGPSSEMAPLVDDLVSRDQSNQESIDAETVEDENGIQRYQMKSVFHRIGKGMIPCPCEGDHLPCEHCLLCWEKEDDSLSEQPLDSATPMPGVLMHVSLSDPLEINIDRPGLDILGVVKALFTKESSSPKPKSPAEDDPEACAANQPDIEEVAQRLATPSKNEKRDDAFPHFMQPEAIQLNGVHIAKLIVRVHVMRGDGQNDCGLSFCYWDVLARCITLDQQNLSAPEKSFQDMRCDIGQVKITEYKGTESKTLVSLGMPLQENSDAESSANASMHGQHTPCTERSAWPSTACTLLNLPAPLETLAYESRERHGLQMRFISVVTPGVDAKDSRSLVNLRVGTGVIDRYWEVKRDAFTIVAECNQALRGGAPEKQATAKPPTEKVRPKATSLMKYKIRMDGGAMNPYPLVNFRLPMTVFTGQRSDKGLFVQSLLNKVTMQYGNPPPLPTPRTAFLFQIASLPESVRMRILFFLSDLDPLEQALCVKKETNSFLRCRAVNKKLAKLAKKSLKHHHRRSFSKHKKSEKTKERRRELMSNIMKLDDASLEDLWHTHQKMRRRHRGLQTKKPPSNQSM